MFSYSQLLVWQKAMDVTAVVYRLVRQLPKEELYALSDQMRRCAVSIPSNIAEGHTRHSVSEYTHFISIAQGSRAELETQLLLCVRVGYLSSADIEQAMSMLEEIGKMLSAITTKLRTKKLTP
ncbi:MAG TPA: four helix bundle protein [Bacteroidales bacterium]|nr:four helix bundle protein [Bacteroidales bacterium]